MLILLFEKFMTDGIFKMNDEGVLCNIGLAFSHLLPFVDDVRVCKVVRTACFCLDLTPFVKFISQEVSQFLQSDVAAAKPLKELYAFFFKILMYVVFFVFLYGKIYI